MYCLHFFLPGLLFCSLSLSPVRRIDRILSGFLDISTRPLSPPQVMQAIEQGSPVSRALFRAAYAYKARSLTEGWAAEGTALGRFYDAVVLSKVRARLGGRVRMVVSGASPISKEVRLRLLQIRTSFIVLSTSFSVHCVRLSVVLSFSSVSHTVL
jgi:hypothetical protein